MKKQIQTKRKINLLEKSKKYKKEFNSELRKAMNTGIVAAFGFLIALTWKEVITEYVETLTQISPIKGKLIQAFLITIISVLGILLVTKIFSQKE